MAQLRAEMGDGPPTARRNVLAIQLLGAFAGALTTWFVAVVVRQAECRLGAPVASHLLVLTVLHQLPWVVPWMVVGAFRIGPFIEVAPRSAWRTGRFTQWRACSRECTLVWLAFELTLLFAVAGAALGDLVLSLHAMNCCVDR
ncbi:MAG: hypothetical protein AAGF12_11775 [Myxococcota bacterium]